VNIDPANTPVTYECKELSLRSAMRLMFHPMGLAYVQRDGALVVTTEKDAEMAEETAKAKPEAAGAAKKALDMLAQASAAAPAEKAPAESGESIRQSLTKKVSWDFTDLPLSEFVEILHKDLGVPVRLDIKALNDMGITPETTITVNNMSGVSAKSALRFLLKDIGLTSLVDGEALVITTPEVADNHLTTVLYNVADLPAFRRPNGKTVPNYDKLIDVIVKSIKPTSWAEVGGTGSILEYDATNVQVLVVSQNDEAHEEILELLNRLRKLHEGPLSPEEIESLPPEPQPKARPHGPPFGAPQSPRGPVSGMGGMGGGMGGMAPPPRPAPANRPAGTPATPNDPFGAGPSPTPEGQNNDAPNAGGMGMF
jgi:hypothetical protein